MEPGNIVEYIDRGKMICAVVLEINNLRLKVLTENNREVKLSMGRLSAKSDSRLDLSMGRDALVETLKETARVRSELAAQVDVKELWELFHSEEEWIDLPTMTQLCFPDQPGPDHEAAILRAFFENRVYFKFQMNRFFPNTEEKIEQLTREKQEAEHREHLIRTGSRWLRALAKKPAGAPPDALTDDQGEILEILKSIYVFGKDSLHFRTGLEILSNAGIDPGDELFRILVRNRHFSPDENIPLYQMEIPVDFSDDLMHFSTSLLTRRKKDLFGPGREDLTNLEIITIDGQATQDFDDAISIEEKNGHYRLGVHIADVAHYIKKGDLIDREASQRASSIYMPDQKIPMLPSQLSEDLCSLREGEFRPAISTLIDIARSGEIHHFEIIPSVISVKHQLTYYEVNMMINENPAVANLYDIAKKFRNKRILDGALQLVLPEINIWLNEQGEVVVNKMDRESPARMLVSEIMIMANWLMAKFLAEKSAPAIFRSQASPKTRLAMEDGGTLFQNWMQRKQLSRFMLKSKPERHSGLGLDYYLTGTSPIRKYTDLVTQRQIRALLDLEPPYSDEEIEEMIKSIQRPMRDVARVQSLRRRYWLLKHMEPRVGEKELAIVLGKRKDNFLALLTEYLLECEVPTSGMSLKPQDVVQITIQHVNARKDLLAVHIG